MIRTLATAAAILIAAGGSAFASYAPIKYAKSRAELASLCQSLGSNGKGYGLDSESGAYGCRNLTTGGAVQCDGNGQCTDYSGDFRWKRVHDLVTGGQPQKGLRFSI